MANKKTLHLYEVRGITGGFGNPGAVSVLLTTCLQGEEPEGAKDLGPVPDQEEKK